MPPDLDSAELLNQISGILGIDAEVFRALNKAARSDAVDEVGSEHRSIVQLHRLVAAFHSLPTDNARLRALEIVEMLASHANNDASPQVGGADKEVVS